MNTLRLFRALIGIADPEILLLNPVLNSEGVDIEDVDALSEWCSSKEGECDLKLLAASKFTSLGVFDRSEMGDPIEMIGDDYASAYAPAAFFKWRLLSNPGAGTAFSPEGREFLLDIAVKEKYPPALTSFAFRERDFGREDVFENKIQEAADLGDPYAMNWVGKKLFSSLVAGQRERGLRLLEASANAGFFLACVQLEIIYRYGLHGVSIDIQKADLYSAASDVDGDLTPQGRIPGFE